MVNVKLPKTVKLKTYVATTLVLTVLLLASVGYVLTSNGTTVTVTPQSYTETASYVIFKVGSTYYAKNGSTGEIEFSGTNASQVLQQTANKVGSAGGGMIFIKNTGGTYSLTSDVYLKSNTFIVSDGASITRTSAGASQDVFEIIEQENITIEGLIFKDVYYRAILIAQSTNKASKSITIRNCIFDGSGNFAIYVARPKSGSENFVADGIRIVNNQFYNCGMRYTTSGGGIGIEVAKNVWICNNYFEDVNFAVISFGDHIGDDDPPIIVETANVFVSKNIIIQNIPKNDTEGAIRFRRPTVNNTYRNIYITYNTIVDNGTNTLVYGISVRNEVKHLFITHNSIRNMYWAGINEAHAQYLTVSNNIIYNCGIEGTTNPWAINVVVTKGGTVHNNIIDTAPTGIRQRVEGGTLYIHHNHFYNVTTPQEQNGGLGALFKYNVGFVTENSGTATISSGTSVTFSHGLAGTPNVVLVGWQDTGYGTWSWSAEYKP